MVVLTIKGKRTSIKPLWLGVAGIAALLLVWLLYPTNQGTKENFRTELIALRDSVAQEELKRSEVSSPPQIIREKSKASFLYTVKRGDSFSRIAYNLFGQSSRYKELLATNGWAEDHILHPGDEVKIDL
jgi:hypothetical protein